MPIESPWPPVSVPEVDVWSFFLEHPNRQYPDDHVLYIDVAAAQTLTYRQLRSSAEQWGSGLQEQWGWQKGDTLATMTPNTFECVPVTFGTLLVGGVVSPCNFQYTVDELVSHLKSSGAKGLITNVACVDVALEAASQIGFPLDRILLVGGTDPKNTTAYYSSLQGSITASPKKVTIGPKEDLAFLVYSSGTTGLPKGVMLTHFNVVANLVQYTQVRLPRHWKTDRSVGFLPMYHIYGIAVLMLYPLHDGTTTYIMTSFDLPTFCRTVQDSNITFAYIVPPVALALRRVPSSIDSTSPLCALYQRLKTPLRQGYGMSEAAPGVAGQRTEDWNKPIGCSGHLWPSISAKLVVDGKEVKNGEEGEVCLKGPNVFNGYYNNPAATAASFDADGWYRTGDIGFVDEAGNISITDRVKELIKYNGFQVAPAQLEGLLLGHPAVTDVAVVGVFSDARATELPRAYVVVAAGYRGDDKLEEALHQWFNELVSPHKRLRGGIRFVEAVPKSNAGKILRRVLIEQARKEEMGAGVKARL
ncbi:uncharacterized protein LTR77_010257 [Saxophila tyrrhenica]|uniref:Acetyl-CoA synthetase-like protein n=1 Tax=Saxophila tyrrhenica TaxID=1690608 RepID=A0AAV9NVJ4_9PEZI|nr:hypothetical protein LTR77_010257 [Saxophila tyrrhenica]